jgi:murein L,D-transpeptidase YafK
MSGGITISRDGLGMSGSIALIGHRFPARLLLIGAALSGAMMLAGCNTDGTVAYSSKANAPLSPAMLAELEKKNMDKDSPILVRLFKEEAELEVWKQDRSGRYALLKTYPICRWSGELGPKLKEGDRQAPEGFYSITPGQMNPNSAYYLSFNLGYPNAYDRAWDRTGSQLMVHGDCSSRGCYAMTDEQIGEIFALGRESFFGGQKAFQVQAYPFRMTAENMARHRNNPNYAFWKMLKRGNDHFEVTHLEPKVDVCEKRYIFDAQAPANASTPLRFDPKGKCPVFEVPQEIADAVNDKQRQDEIKIAELTARGAPTAPIRTYADGGMNPVFLAAVQSRGGRDPNGAIALATPIKTEAGTIPATVNPPQPHAAEPQLATALAAPATEAPAPQAVDRKATASKEGPSFMDKLGSLFKPAQREPAAPQKLSVTPTQVAAARPTEPQDRAKNGSLFNRMFSAKASEHKAGEHKTAEAAPKETVTGRIASKLGLRGSGEPAETTKANTASNGKAEAAAIRPEPNALAKTGDDKPARSEAPATGTTQVANGSLMAGSQPIVPSTSFDSRWNAFR